MKILAAMENANQISLFSQTTVAAGLGVPLKATDYTKAIEIFKSDLPDLLFIDYGIGEDTTVKLIKQSRKIKSNIFISIISNSLTEEQTKLLIKLGIQSVLLKPINKVCFNKTIKKFQKHHRSTKAEASDENQKLIEHLVKDKVPVVIEYDRNLEKFKSHFLAVNNNRAILEEFIPQLGNILAEHHKDIRIIVFEDGELIEFYSKITGNKTINGKVAYSITLPTSICHIESRGSDRVEIDFRKPIKATFLNKINSEVSGVIHNISFSGVAIAIDNKQPKVNVLKDDTIENITFNDDDGNCYKFNLRVVRTFDELDKIVIAGKIIFTNEEAKKLFHNYVQSLQQQRADFIQTIKER